MGRACLLPLSRRGRAGASWPIFGPTRACMGLLLEASLSLDLPAQRATFHLPAGVGLPSFLWPSTLGLKGRLFLPAQPVLSSSCRVVSFTRRDLACKCWDGSGGSQEGSWACQLLSALLSVYLSACSSVAEGLCLFS